jgi:AraC family cel operon transcriptional repressor
MKSTRTERPVEMIKAATFLAGNRPIQIGRNVFKDSKNFRVHTHDFHEFFVVTEGSIIHDIDGSREILRKGTVRFIPPSSSHGFRKSGDCRTATIVNTAFQSSLMDGVSPFSAGVLNNPTGPAHIPPAERPILSRKLESITEELGRNPSRAIGILHSILTDLGLILPSRNGAQNEEPPAWLLTAAEAMRKPENYRAGLKRFIEISGRTQPHLNRSVRKHFGQTPTEFVNILRLREAAELLTGTGLKILEISLRAGFNNASHFMRLFRSRYGTSPGRYRRTNRRIVEG